MVYWLILIVVVLAQGSGGVSIRSVATSSMHVGNFSSEKECLEAGRDADKANPNATPGVQFRFICVRASAGGGVNAPP